MKGYQSGIAQFTETDSVVFGVSTDPVATNTEFAQSLDLDFALLSDEDGSVAAAYGVLMAGGKMASRTTFVVGTDGKIAYVESGMGAMDPAGAAGACSKLP
jgi:peroxiredoxin Q/BCP